MIQALSKFNTPKWNIGIIILFHAVGLAGFILPATRDLFLTIVPFHLLLMLAIIWRSYKGTENITAFFWIIVIGSFALEWFGVRTGNIFGYYAYGSTLGYRLVNVPVLIGVNWFLLVYSTGVLMRRLSFKNAWPRIAAGAAVLVMLDMLIEPVAIKFDYWHWTENQIPLQNYLGWYIAGFVMLFIFEKFRFAKQDITAPAFLLTQFAFFALLNLWLVNFAQN